MQFPDFFYAKSYIYVNRKKNQKSFTKKTFSLTALQKKYQPYKKVFLSNQNIKNIENIEQTVYNLD